MIPSCPNWRPEYSVLHSSFFLSHTGTQNTIGQQEDVAEALD